MSIGVVDDLQLETHRLASRKDGSVLCFIRRRQGLRKEIGSGPSDNVGKRALPRAPDERVVGRLVIPGMVL